MTTTPPDAPSGPRVSREEVRDLGRLRRSVTDRKVAGVAGGLARHLDVDPVVLRVAFVVLAFFGGAGLILYGACWLLVPEEGRETAPLGLDERSRSIALIIVGVLAGLALLGDSWNGIWFPWPLAVIGVIALLLMSRRDHRSAPPPAAGPPTAPAASPTSAGPSADEPPTARATAYAAPTAPAYAPPPTYAGAPPRPVDPRRRGPLLFWFTLALLVLLEGVLGIVDVAGLDVPGSAYPALAVATIGTMLLVGAFFGRAGGLILLGLVASLVLAVATAADSWDGSRVHESPRTAADVAGSYDMSTGELTVDLTEVRDPAALAGRTLHLDGDVGRIALVVPDDLDVAVHADVDGPGSIELFQDERGGIDVSLDATHHDRPATEPLVVDASLGVGRIEVQTR